MTIILAGIPGAGKSTVLNALKSTCPSVTVVNYGEMMLQEAAHLGLDRDSLRQLPIDKQQDIGVAASHRIAHLDSELTIVDTHACIKTPFGYCPGLPQKILNVLCPNALVMVQATPATILERRQFDHSRKRDEESLDQLAQHQELTQAYLVSASVITGAIFCVINNDVEDVFQSITPLVQLVEMMERSGLSKLVQDYQLPTTSEIKHGNSKKSVV
ncbi:MAG: adenylate kinase [Parachlamydiaceae bacterium]|nr:adenylate kinase [Parachlamydiaceae bacterium]